MTSADVFSVMPLIITAGAALLVLLAGPFLSRRVMSVIGVVAPCAAGAYATVGTVRISPAMPGLSFSPLGRYLIPIFCFSAALTILFSHGYNIRRGINGEEYPATVLFALFAMCTLPCSTNLLILFLALESVAFSFYILVAMDLASAESREAGLKYLLIGAVSAAFTAFGISLIYAGSGSLGLSAALNFTDRAVATAGWGMIITGVAFKLSLVPAHLWTPDVYQGAPAPVTAFLSTGSKVAAAGFILMLLSFSPPIPELHVPLYLLSLLSMVMGNLAALLQKNLKRMLAYSSIAHMGYLALALLTGSRDGYVAVLLYAAIYTAMSLAAFGAVASLSGTEERSQLADYAGLGFVAPFRGGVLALSMVSLAGIPPTAGFIGKFFIFYAALQGGETTLAVIGILSAAASAYFYLRVVVHLYMQGSQGPAPQPVTRTESVALAAGALAIVAIGIFPSPLLTVVETAFK